MTYPYFTLESILPSFSGMIALAMIFTWFVTSWSVRKTTLKKIDKEVRRDEMVARLEERLAAAAAMLKDIESRREAAQAETRERDARLRGIIGLAAGRTTPRKDET